MQHARVERETFGHLDSPPGSYPGYAVFAVSIFGDGQRAVFEVDFGEAGDGPWFYEALMDRIHDERVSEGVYRLDGSYVIDPKAPKVWRVEGEIKRLEVPS
jgi:hypothetical protein